jgi:hypothetical protein
LFANIGVSKTFCTGRWTSFSTRIRREVEKTTPANLAVLRRLALNIARAHPDTKTSLRGKPKRAAWDDSFLVDMLLNMR